MSPAAKYSQLGRAPRKVTRESRPRPARPRSRSSYSPGIGGPIQKKRKSPTPEASSLAATSTKRSGPLRQSRVPQPKTATVAGFRPSSSRSSRRRSASAAMPPCSMNVYTVSDCSAVTPWPPTRLRSTARDDETTLDEAASRPATDSGVQNFLRLSSSSWM